MMIVIPYFAVVLWFMLYMLTRDDTAMIVGNIFLAAICVAETIRAKRA